MKKEAYVFIVLGLMMFQVLNGQSLSVNIISDPNPPNVCPGDTIILTASPSAGATPYTYMWSQSAATTAEINIIPSESKLYTVTVTDANSVSATKEIMVTVNPLPIPMVINDGPITCSNSIVTLTASGGATYLWSGGGTNNTKQITSIGTYSVTVTSVNGCKASASTTVNQDINPPIAVASNDGPLTCVKTNVTLTALGGIAYKWSGGQNINTFTINNAGTYTVTVTSVNGCSSSASTTVIENILPPSVSITDDGILTCNKTTTKLTATGGGTYQWSGGETTSTTLINTPGSYTVTVTSTSNGCKSSLSKIVVQDIMPPIAYAGADISVCPNENVNILASGGTSYNWGSGLMQGQIINPSSSVSYTVTVTGQNGCTATDQLNITVFDVPSINIKIEVNPSNNLNYRMTPDSDNVGLIEKYIYTIKDKNTNTVLTTKEFINFEVYSETFELGKEYEIMLKIITINGCVNTDTKYISVNSQDCSSFKLGVSIDEIPLPSSISAGNLIFQDIKVCNKDSITITINGDRGDLAEGSVSLYINGILIEKKNKPQDGKFSINKKLIIAKNESTLDLRLEYVVKNISSPNPIEITCNHTFRIINFIRPKFSLIPTTLCYNDSMEIKLNSNLIDEKIINFSYKFQGDPSNTSFKYPEDKKINVNKNKVLQNINYNLPVILNSVQSQESIGTCPPQNDSLTITVKRTPEINLVTTVFCKDRELKAIINQESNATYRWKKDGIITSEIINGQTFGSNISETSTYSVSGSINHGLLICSSDEKMINFTVNKLPVAVIDEYLPNCGPFFKAGEKLNSLNNKATFSWSLDGGNEGITEILNKDIIAVTGLATGKLLILSVLNDKNCSHKDTVEIKGGTYMNETNDNNKILTRICKDSTLYYIENLSSNDCYKWFLISPEGNIEVLNNDNPFILDKASNKPYLIKFKCTEECKSGTIVSKRTSSPDHNCDDDVIELESSSFKLFPIPASDIITIYAAVRPKGIIQYKVFDSMAKLISLNNIDHRAGEFKTSMDITHLMDGLYFIDIEGEILKMIIVK